MKIYNNKLVKLFKRNYAQADKSNIESNFKRDVSGKAGIHHGVTGIPNVKKSVKRFTNLMSRLDRGV